MSNKVKEKLEKLIEQGKHVKSVNFVEVNEPGLIMPDYIFGEEYDLWMNKVKIFTSKYCKEHILYDEIINAYKIRKNSWGTSAYDAVMSYLNSLLNDGDFIKDNTVDTDNYSNLQKTNQDEKMLFISHSSLDIDYVSVLVELLEDIGFKGKSHVFCSSVSGYGIPMGKHIYDYLKEQFNKELHVIYLLSENYYNSPACLNEMGAAWVQSKRHTAILVPGFNYNQIRGSVDASKIWFRMDAVDKINEFKNELIGEFDLDDLDENYWDRRKEKYIKEINSIYENNKHKSSPQIVELEGIEEYGTDDELRCFFRFINKGNIAIKCTYINIEIEDKYGGKADITLSNRDLNNLILYNYENKRVEIIANKRNYNISSSFNPYLWSKYKIIDSGWSKVV